MLDPKYFYDVLKSQNINFYTGVPDSLLKHFCTYIQNNTSPSNHIIAANEGGAIALATGYHLATGNIPLVYMQNSGLGNAINPLLSLTHSSVNSIPILLLIGWRAEPNSTDEPQHQKQGEITLDLLQLLDIPYSILSHHSFDSLYNIIHLINKNQSPGALVVKKNTFLAIPNNALPISSSLEIDRNLAISLILKAFHNIPHKTVATTGKIARELYSLRQISQSSHNQDFLSIGSMGHASQIALGLALQNPILPILCLDGDGSLLMHMGSLAIIGSQNNLNNFKHILLNNGCHDSVGGQPTAGFKINFLEIAKGCGYSFYKSASSHSELICHLNEFIYCKGPALLEIKIKKDVHSTLLRPQESPLERKIEFMKSLSPC